MFLQVSVILSTGGTDVHGCSRGGMRGCSWGGGHAWLLWGGGMRGFFDEIRSMSRRYASYWNAFLFQSVIHLFSPFIRLSELGTFYFLKIENNIDPNFGDVLNFVTCEECSHLTKFSPIFNIGPILFSIVSMVTG